MKRIVAVGAIAVLIVCLAPPVSAGGGCHGPFTDELTTTVGLGMNCFTPTIARVSPGDTVRFVNKDKVAHAIGGIGDTFGHHVEIAGKKELSFTFKDEGVFPYVCIYHAGMGGAIVVGDGQADGAAAGSGVTMEPDIEGASAAGSASEAETTAASQPSDRGWTIAVGIAIGLVLLVIAALPRRRSIPQA